jgi:hypothetical protein
MRFSTGFEQGGWFPPGHPANILFPCRACAAISSTSSALLPAFKDELPVIDADPPHATDAGAARLRTRWDWACRGPLLAAAVIICLINARNLDRLVRAAAPRNPWEATETLEAWRSLQGMPVYELGANAHATHVYGALVPLVQAEIFRWVGPNNVSGRLLSLVSGLLTVTLLALALRGQRAAWYLAVAWAMLLGVNFRSGSYFAENRPDMTALMFAALGVLLIAGGLESGRRWSVVLGSLVLAVGFFFKQTAFVFAAVPPVALVLRGRRPRRSEFLLAFLPLAVALGVILGLRILNPAAYHYMIVVPKAFGLRWAATARNGWELLLDTPLFLVLLGEWVVVERASFHKDSRLLWLAAVLAVTIPYSAVTSAKVGGTDNSLLPALFAMAAFCVLRLPRVLKYVDRPGSPLTSRLAAGSFLALLLLLTAFPRLSNKHPLFVARSRHDRAYWKVVELIKQLPGTVVCPEDPTIVFYGKRQLGLNIYSECDAHLVGGTYPATPPEPVLRDIRAADYLVDVYDDTQNFLKHDDLQSLGFEPVTFEDAAMETSDYRLWRRARDSNEKTLATRNEPSAR